MTQTMQAEGLSVAGVNHSFADNTVLQNVTLAVEPGEILALVGENGAGKSTLMRLISGYLPVQTGRIEWQNAPRPADVGGCERAGLTLVHQEFALIADLTVAENISLGREPRRLGLIDRRAMAERAKAALSLLGAGIGPSRMLRDLPVADWQMVELARAFSAAPRLLLMDEPTAVLGRRETEALFARMRAFREAGGAVIFTSHRLDEVRDIADRVAVLRDGAITLEAPAESLGEQDIAAAMVGRALDTLFPPRRVPARAAPLLEVEGLHVRRPLGEDVGNASLALHPGEILGVAGLVGAGRSELFEGLCGLRPASADRFALKGTPQPLPRAPEAWAQGIAYLTEDRKARGLWLDADLVTNTSLTHGALGGPAWIDRRAERARYDAAQQRYGIRAAHPGIAVSRLSGGNQQKVLFAKTLASDPGIVILDEPTRGVDIGAKAQIYEVIAGLAAEGRAVVLISSELPELIGLSHRILVMDRGRIAGILTQPQDGDLTEAEILHLALGLPATETAA